MCAPVFIQVSVCMCDQVYFSLWVVVSTCISMCAFVSLYTPLTVSLSVFMGHCMGVSMGASHATLTSAFLGLYSAHHLTFIWAKKGSRL